ncbi:hypothetical protein HN51_069577 [Arachis hypogaea]
MVAPPLHWSSGAFAMLTTLVQVFSEGAICCDLLVSEAVDSGLLLKLSFNTIFEYLQMLQIISKPMKDIGPRAMFYLI